MGQGIATLKHQLLIGVIGITLLLGASRAVALDVGDKAPDFAWWDTCRQEVSMWLPITGWLLAALLLVLGPQPVAAASPQLSMVSSDPEVLELGGRLFEQNCSPCHGKNAVGEDPATPMGGWKAGIGHLAPALNGTGHAWHHPPSYHMQIIRRGSTLQESRMMGWDTRMSDFEIVAVIAYFESLWPSHIKAAYQRRYLYRVEE